MNECAKHLSAFVIGEIGASDLIAALQPRVVFSKDRGGATRVDYRGAPLPHVTFRKADVIRMLKRALAGETTVEELAEWANLVTLLDCFDLQPGVENEDDDIWDALARIANPAVSGVDDNWKLKEMLDTL